MDQCAEYPEWARKIEEDVGAQIAILYASFDETSRD
jgi:hypothetical protein